ncbi:hypothetical protein ACHAXA_006452 [Cyclostephanos tholiformis]|uniref:Uncharacterized protein n=1 Tax=Cyclostephanos tholiformis TaxID=382380 RepID=A0ABD3SFB0_9STRA
MVSKEEIAEINAYFRGRMDESKKIWMTRGKDARIASAAARAASGAKTWRQMSGMSLMMHEVGHVGNRHFMVGFGFIGLMALYAQTKFTDDMRKNSPYWSTFHEKGQHGGH